MTHQSHSNHPIKLVIKIMNLKSLILLISALTVCDSYRILGIFPLVARSHMMFFEQTMKGLARRGHQVNVISVFPQKKPHPNYTDLEIPLMSPNLVNNMTLDFVKTFFEDIDMIYYFSGTFGNGLCEKGFETPVVQKLLKNTANPPYDLVIVECTEKNSIPANACINNLLNSEI
ncbi:UDP-glycosyltransferase UGT5-like [Cotesia typhae]|uniref:UDP-glycosyltransferase UGT5-like n=1 Tax=Cotesia typhae TaxID=2053667 RepID=UPI003D688D43